MIFPFLRKDVHLTPEHLPVTVDYRQVNGVNLECAIVGAAGRPLVILLHGFPNLWQGWHCQLSRLSNEFRLMLPNQRGYGASDKPKGIAAYDLDELAKDVVGLADSEGAETFDLVGHDWGGIVAWWVAACYPARVKRLVILNAPHPGAFFSYLVRSPTQWLRSWYIGVFQLPWLTEYLLSRRHFELLFRCVKGTSLPGVFDDSDRAYLVAGWAYPGALKSMIHYYRAISRRSSRSLQRRTEVPTLILMSQADPTEEAGLAEASLAWCDDGRIEWFAGTAHWIQREAATRVGNAIAMFLAAGNRNC